ncbi:MAG: FxLYD domain-containing protein [Anaerolineae bacterium]|nr:FxLYD domain-containing protein [Anaerolineae bacterium]
MARQALLILLGVLTAIAAGCGQVITRPTATPEPSATATSTPTQRPQARPTATPEPTPLPSPTATPSPTPTPVYYRIQAGDNLYIIARKFGVTREALLAVNEIENERALQVGQLLLIPLAGETGPPEPTPTYTPTPLPVQVVNVYFHPSPLGELTVLGEARNASGMDLERVLVRITLFDGADRPLASGQAYTELEVLAPGERGPFAVRFAEPPQGFASYQAEVLAAAPAYTGSLHRDLRPVDVTSEETPGGALRIAGRLLNVGAEEAIQTTVVVTAYDPLGRVVAVRRVAPEHPTVARGGEVAFAVDLIPAGPVDSFAVQPQARLRPTPTLRR